MKMELELDQAEVETILLAYAEQKFPGMFNKIELDMSYGSLRRATLTKEPEPEPIMPPPSVPLATDDEPF